MPELPDVEVFRQYFNQTSLNRKIRNVEIMSTDLLETSSSRSIQMQLKGQQFSKTLRHGKYLFAQYKEEGWLILHFGMTGFLKYFKNESERPGHIRLQIDFDNNYYLAYDCQRKLGLIDLTSDPEKFIKEKELGADPYREQIEFDQFKMLFEGKRGSVKSALMNQSLLAGIGNVYSDEILFQADVHPASELKKMKSEDLKKIFDSLQKVLQKTIESKANPARLPSGYLVPHRGKSDECPRCGGKLDSKKISGRTSYFCRKHQSKPN